MIFCCSCSRYGIARSLFAIASKPVHVLVMELVCCPANNTAINIPKTSVGWLTRPVFIPRVDKRLQHVRLQTPAFSSRLNDLIKNQRQLFPSHLSSYAPRSARTGKTPTTVPSLYPNRAPTPSPRKTNSLESLSPSKHLLAVKTISSLNESNKSTSPSSPHFSKNAFASFTIIPTYVLKRSLFSDPR